MHFTCKDSGRIKSIQTIEKISMFSNKLSLQTLKYMYHDITHFCVRHLVRNS